MGFVFVHLDEILLASNSSQAHFLHLKQLFQRLSDHGKVINLSKRKFGCSHLDFLEHCIDKTGACPLPDKVDAIQKFSRLSTINKLRRSIGVVNFYHRFILLTVRFMAPVN